MARTTATKSGCKACLQYSQLVGRKQICASRRLRAEHGDHALQVVRYTCNGYQPL